MSAILNSFNARQEAEGLREKKDGAPSVTVHKNEENNANRAQLHPYLHSPRTPGGRGASTPMGGIDKQCGNLGISLPIMPIQNTPNLIPPSSQAENRIVLRYHEFVLTVL